MQELMLPNYAPPVIVPVKGESSHVTKKLERDAMIVNAAKIQSTLPDEEKLKSSYEDFFSDVVTLCYVRGYN